MPTFDRPFGAAAIRRKTDSICGAQGAFGDQCGPGGPKGNPNRQVVGTLLPLWLCLQYTYIYIYIYIYIHIYIYTYTYIYIYIYNETVQNDVTLCKE